MNNIDFIEDHTIEEEQIVLGFDYYCETCGTILEDNRNGYCANGHDDWLFSYFTKKEERARHKITAQYLASGRKWWPKKPESYYRKE